MTREETVRSLQQSAGVIRGLGVTSLHLFGSAARDELTSKSDIDLFVDYDPNGQFSFIELVRLQKLLASKLAREVDLTTRDGLHPRLRAGIELSAIKIF
jgi:uncharacterized protein